MYMADGDLWVRTYVGFLRTIVGACCYMLLFFFHLPKVVSSSSGLSDLGLHGKLGESRFHPCWGESH